MTPQPPPLPSSSFFSYPPQQVAQKLLGALLVRKLGDRRVTGRIVETEAYDGPSDLACHASKGRTPRTEPMFGPPGRTYIYFTYGMHWCLNLVTGPLGYPAAVLIRALEPVEGLDIMVRLRGTSDPSRLSTGPSCVCQALGLTGTQNNHPLGPELGLWIEPRRAPPPMIRSGPRIGVEYAKAYRLKLWRYFIQKNPFVSQLPKT